MLFNRFIPNPDGLCINTHTHAKSRAFAMLFNRFIPNLDGLCINRHTHTHTLLFDAVQQIHSQPKWTMYKQTHTHRDRETDKQTERQPDNRQRHRQTHTHNTRTHIYIFQINELNFHVEEVRITHTHTSK